MDDRVLELLSRAVDDDLDPEEAAELERLLEERPELGTELAALRATRMAVSALAAEMHPPATLDRLMVPLRRAAPPPSERGRKLQWLAAAAAVLASLALAYQVGRQHRPKSPSLAALQAVAQAPVPDFPEYFKLKPLPTAPVGEMSPGSGAVDRLMATPDVAPTAEPGPPLVVVGPLAWPGLPVARLELATPRSRMVIASELPAECGRPPIRVGVSVSGERVVAAAAAEPDHPALAAACAEALIGTGASGVANGTYSGRLVAPDVQQDE
jgi:anti-sigma factor RsiW